MQAGCHRILGNFVGRKVLFLSCRPETTGHADVPKRTKRSAEKPGLGGTLRPLAKPLSPRGSQPVISSLRRRAVNHQWAKRANLFSTRVLVRGLTSTSFDVLIKCFGFNVLLESAEFWLPQYYLYCRLPGLYDSNFSPHAADGRLRRGQFPPHRVCPKPYRGRRWRARLRWSGSSHNCDTRGLLACAARPY